MSNLTCFCRPRLSWWLLFLKCKGRWDPGEENILVSSVLPINKAQRLFDSSQHIPHEFTGLGLATGPPPGNYMDRLPEGLALMWLSESTQKLFIFPRALGNDPSVASYWRKTQREKNCALHTEGSSDSDPIPPCSDEARTASILNGDRVTYFLRGPCAWNQNNHRWIHKSRKSLELCLSWVCTLECPEGSYMQHKWIKLDLNKIEWRGLWPLEITFSGRAIHFQKLKHMEPVKQSHMWVCLRTTSLQIWFTSFTGSEEDVCA